MIIRAKKGPHNVDDLVLQEYESKFTILMKLFTQLKKGRMGNGFMKFKHFEVCLVEMMNGNIQFGCEWKYFGKGKLESLNNARLFVVQKGFHDLFLNNSNFFSLVFKDHQSFSIETGRMHWKYMHVYICEKFDSGERNQRQCIDFILETFMKDVTEQITANA